MRRAIWATAALALASGTAHAQVFVRAPFVRVEVGGPGVAVRAPFVNLYVPSGPRVVGPPIYLPPGALPPGYGPPVFVPPPQVVAPLPTQPIPAPLPEHRAQAPLPRLEPDAPPATNPAPPATNPDFAPPAPSKMPTPPTLDEFRRSFQPKAGHYEIELLNPLTRQPTTVRFSLPEGSPRMNVSRDQIEFRYGPRNFVRIDFDRDGATVTSR